MRQSAVKLVQGGGGPGYAQWSENGVTRSVDLSRLPELLAAPAATAGNLAAEIGGAATDVRCYLDWIQSAPDGGYGPAYSRWGRGALVVLLRDAERRLLDARAKISDAALALDEAKAAAKAQVQP